MSKSQQKIVVVLIIFLIGVVMFSYKERKSTVDIDSMEKAGSHPSPTPTLFPLSIVAMRQRSYPGSPITIEQTLADGSNYHQYIASYLSDGLKIYALLTVPIGQKPSGGWPVILFNHGYIPPATYRTTERYVAYVDEFARNGYIVFKPDYRGNGESEGKPEGAYFSPAYTVDDLNALASIKKYKDSNPQRVGIWGHSMGGNITLRDLVVRPADVKAAVIWGGVVGSYSDFTTWHDPSYHPSQLEQAQRSGSRESFFKTYGTPAQNPEFWNSIDPTYFVSDISVPVQLDVGGADEEVPPAFSQSLRDTLQKAGKKVEYFEYPGADHNISQSLDLALENSVEFFNKYVKGK